MVTCIEFFDNYYNGDDKLDVLMGLVNDAVQGDALKIEKAYNNLKENLGVEIFYAVKANSNLAILKLLNNCGAGSDTVSAGEIQRSIKAGFNPNKIIYEGVGKSKEDIEYAIINNIRLINAESLNELILINKIAKNLNKTGSGGGHRSGSQSRQRHPH